MKRLSIFVGTLALMSAFFLGALVGLQQVFLDPARYIALQDRLNVYDSVGISRAEQALIDQDLADYLRGDIDSLERRVTLFGEDVDCAFNARELAHMEDVRRLFSIGFCVKRALIMLTAVLLLAAFLLKRRAGRGAVRWSAALSLGILALAGGAAVLIIGRLGFSNVFIQFHRLIFDNELWLLNPATDAMIRMLPEAFFEGMAAQGAASAALFAALFYAAGVAALIVFGRIGPKRK